MVRESGAGLVLLEADLYFPNRSLFEERRHSGLLLCGGAFLFLPARVVRRAIGGGIRVARHGDMGVARWRAFVDLEWREWGGGGLGGANPRAFACRVIVWGALAMGVGGGDLDPEYWRCWFRSPLTRVKTKLGASGLRILKSEPWTSLKCFHAGGEAKWWLHAARETGLLDGKTEHIQPGRVIPFVELKPVHYARERALKEVLRAFGYYRIFRPA